MEKVIVNGCDTCPFLYRSEECQGGMFDCQHPKGINLIIHEKKYDPITPNDCPLKIEEILVSFMQK